jgi:peptidoglycan/LPS O-acetylase OafA/YrhL
MQLRLIRLMPLIVLGILLSAFYIVLRSGIKTNPVPYDALLLAIVLGVTNIPYFNPPVIIGGPQIFPLNGPQWSLFYELVVNIIWAPLVHLPVKFFAAIAAIGFIVLAFTGFYGGDTTDYFYIGLPRVCASFCAGIVIHHVSPKLSASWPWRKIFWAASAVMVLIFFVPGELPHPLLWLWITVGSPLVVLSGTKVILQGSAEKFALLSGELSYPIYCLHFPIFAWTNGIYRYFNGDQNIAVELPLVVVVVAILSYLALRYYDEPVRALITKRLASSRSNEKLVPLHSK